ncbi:undecaprenyl-diphosphatase [Frankineae bacterium MT45]|nr:undecaprenyl-diphosphatase [Frankineae bacterium MT45]
MTVRYPATARSWRWLGVLAAGSVVVYLAMWVGYRQQWGWLDALDTHLLNTARTFGVEHPGWVSFWNTLCTVAGPNAYRLLGVAAGVLALLRRNLRAAVFLLVGIGLSGTVAQLAKNLADRPRPPGQLATAASSSFPSGHAVGVMVGVLSLLTVFWPSVTRLRAGLRYPVECGGAALILAVGFGRVALVVHHPSDVLAGWALGYLWFFVSLATVRPAPIDRISVAGPGPDLDPAPAPDGRPAERDTPL